MPGTADTEFSLGQQYWCVHPQLEAPFLGTIVALTDAIGKRIGLDFGEFVGGHTCDGRTSQGQGLWVLPEHIYNETEWDEVVGVLSAQKAFKLAVDGHSYKAITIDPATGEVVTSLPGGQPAMQKAKPTNMIFAAKE